MGCCFSKKADNQDAIPADGATVGTARSHHENCPHGEDCPHSADCPHTECPHGPDCPPGKNCPAEASAIASARSSV